MLKLLHGGFSSWHVLLRAMYAKYSVLLSEPELLQRKRNS